MPQKIEVSEFYLNIIHLITRNHNTIMKNIIQKSLECKVNVLYLVDDIASNEVFNFWADIYHDHKVGLYFNLSRMMTISAVIGTQFNDN